VSQQIRDQLQKTLGTAYTLERELGGGGMSQVFLAVDTRLKRKVVVKVLAPEMAQGISVDRFEREIQTAAALQQANIVPVLSAGETNGLPFYTMPFVEGESLRHRLGRGPLTTNEVVSVLRDVARALAYAHARGVVHRDIKPDNVLLSGGAAVVTDFGIAKAISASRTGAGGATLTSVGTSIGTPAYMAPEQAAGDPNVDHRADIYALGAMAYELLSGQPVFAGRTPQRMLAAHMGEAPKNIAELRPDTPAQLGEMVMRCLAKEASDRPQSAGEVVQSLETTSGGSMPLMPAVLLGGPGMFRKALAIYAGAFVVVAVLAKAAIVGIGLPDWVFPGSLIVMALGLPVVLWTGYVQRVARRAALATPTYTPGGTPSMASGTIQTMALKAAPKMSWYRTARGGAYAMATFVAMIAIAMGMRAANIGPFATLRDRLGDHASLVLTDFRVSNGDSTLGRVVSDAVRAGLTGSNAFTLTPPTTVVAALGRMKRPPNTRLDSAVVREIAQREGIRAYVDGEVTGVAGGYVIAIRLVRADSGIEMASFRETGDGPRGIIDASDKLARALRSKAGESLKRVQTTPPLAQATSASLDALKKHSESGRLNNAGQSCQAVGLSREAVAIDSTFASAWNGMAGAMSNCRSQFSQAQIDSASRMAFRFREKLPANERDQIAGRYYGVGAGRDRNKSIAAYGAILQRGDSLSAPMVNIAEMLRTKREFARAESLNTEAARRSPGNAVPLGNAAEMQMNQGKYKEAAATAERLRALSMTYGVSRRQMLLYMTGDYEGSMALADSMAARGVTGNIVNIPRRIVALTQGRLKDVDKMFGSPKLVDNPEYAADRLHRTLLVRGRSPAVSAGLDSVLAAIRFADIPMVDRPYLDMATLYAMAGHPDKARALVARYRAEVTDTSLRRVNEYEVVKTLAEIALAEGKFAEALEQFRKGDIGFDGDPANECSFCLSEDLGRAFDAAGMPDSAIVMYERYLATPHWWRAQMEGDPPRLAAMHERLGQLYEAKGDAPKAAEHYQRFVTLWAGADPELQPRVVAAKERLKKLKPVEAPKR
jgi:tetratricopeptide (TPR) repeat protein